MSIENAKQEVRQLIAATRAGDQHSFEILLTRYKPLIDSLASRFSADELLRTQIDDIKQEATLAFYNTVLEYDMEQTEVEFGLYAKMWITFHLRSLREKQKKHQSEFLVDSVGDAYYVHDSEDPTGRILEEERIASLYSVIRKNLSDFEFCIWQLYMSGRTAKEIALAVGKSEKSVTNTIYRSRKKLRQSCADVVFFDK